MSNWAALRALISDTEQRLVRADAATHALQTITYPHHETHAGSRYKINGVIDVASGDVVDIRITTPNTTKWGHFEFFADAEGEFDIWLYMGVAIVTAGTALTPINRNHNSANTSGLAFDLISNASIALADADTTITSAVTIDHNKIGSGKSFGGKSGTRDEDVLKQNTIYSARFQNNGVGTLWLNYHFDWYEHTDKD